MQTEKMIFIISFALCLCRIFAIQDRNQIDCGAVDKSTGNSNSGKEVIDYQRIAKQAMTAQVAFVQKCGAEDFRPLCSGVLVTRRHVLTAAHCLVRNNPNCIYEARIGSTDYSQGKAFTILAIKIHEGYKSGKYYDDIALVTLAEAIEDPKFGVVCLPDKKLAEKNLTGLGLTLAGWGEQEIGRGTSFYTSTLKVASNHECNQAYNTASYRKSFPKGIATSLLCAYYIEGEKNACSGDSGSPMMFLQGSRWYTIGITVFGVCGSKNLPLGATRVSSYTDWIRNNIKTCV